MKQKTRFQNFENIPIGCRSMNGQYIGIGPKKAISADLWYKATVTVLLISRRLDA